MVIASSRLSKISLRFLCSGRTKLIVLHRQKINLLLMTKLELVTKHTLEACSSPSLEESSEYPYYDAYASDNRDPKSDSGDNNKSRAESVHAGNGGLISGVDLTRD